MEVETVQVKPWAKDQGDFVVINKSDFDPSKHELYEDHAEAGAKAGKGTKKPAGILGGIEIPGHPEAMNEGAPGKKI